MRARLNSLRTRARSRPTRLASYASPSSEAGRTRTDGSIGRLATPSDMGTKEPTPTNVHRPSVSWGSDSWQHAAHPDLTRTGDIMNRRVIGRDGRAVNPIGL